MKKIFLCVLFAVFVIGINPSHAFRNNCDAIMSDLMAAKRERMDLQQFLDESRPGTKTHNKMGRELRQNSTRTYQLEKEYQKCMEWRKKNQ